MAKKRYKVLYGGRVSSKSWSCAGFAVMLSTQYKVNFLCVRQFQKKIKDSVYTLIINEINRLGVANQFKITTTEIKNTVTGSTFKFYGLYQHVDEIKSIEDMDICWIEEAHALTKEQWEILDPTIRNHGGQFWIVFNPQLVTDFVYQYFVVDPPKNTIKFKINYTDNPFISSTILAVANNKKELDEDGYNHIWLGEPKANDESSIIKASWIRAAIDAHKVLDMPVTGVKKLGFDPADGSDDPNSKNDDNSFCYTHGFVTIDLEKWQAGEDELEESATRCYNYCIKNDLQEMYYDCIGVGAAAGSTVKRLNETNNTSLDYFKFRASDRVMNPDENTDPEDDKSPLNKDHYTNVKAQVWFELARRFLVTYNAVVNYKPYCEDDIISISSDCRDIESLITQLSSPRKKYDNSGRVMVEKKKDMLKRGIRSPNDADAFVMSNSNLKVVKRGMDVF